MLTDKLNAIWKLAASGTTSILLTAMTADANRIAGNAAIDRDSFAHWLQVRIAQPTSLNLVYPIQVYYSYLEYIDGYEFNATRLLASAEPPANPLVSGTSVTCDEDASGASRTARLYLWDYANFSNSGINGVLDGEGWTFENVPPGNCVLAFETESLPTAFLTVGG